jgi:PAS domain S-box-containing protein
LFTRIILPQNDFHIQPYNFRNQVAILAFPSYIFCRLRVSLPMNQPGQDEDMNADTPSGKMSGIEIKKGTAVSHYTVDSKLGQGYPDYLYLVTDNNLGRKAVLQFLPSRCNDHKAGALFSQEAQTVAGVSHPNLVHIYEVSEFENRPFVVLEYVGDHTLHDIIAESDIPSRQAVDIAIQICAGIRALHDSDIVHRDLRPKRISVDGSGRVQLHIMGHFQRLGSPPEISNGNNIGVSDYVSPEQIAGEEPDYQSNIFSLGVILYEMITGKHPFRRRQKAETMRAIVEAAAPMEHVKDQKDQIPKELSPIIEKALAKRRDSRYLRIEYLLGDLECARNVELLRESEEQYRNVVERANDGICIIQNKEMKFINQRLADMVGYTVEEGIDTSFADYLHPDEISRVVEKYNLQISGRETSQRYETILLHKKGHEVPVEINAGLITYEGHTAILAIVRDISERKISEAALRESEEKFSNLFQHSNDAIFLHDLDGNIIDVNQKTLEIFRYSKSEMLAMQIADLHPPGAHEASRQAFEKIMKDGFIRFEVDFIRKNGKVFPAEVSSGILQVGGQTIVQGIVRDITERKRADEAFRESRRTLATLMSNLPGMVYRCNNDRDWTMIFISDGCKELTGYEVSEVVDNARIAYNELIHPEDRENVWSDVQAAIEKQETFQLLYRIITKEKQEKWVWEQGCGIFSDDGELLALEGFIADITKRRQAEEHLHLYTSVVKQSAEGIALADLEGNLQIINKAFAEMHGYSSEELLHKNLSIFHTPDQMPEVEAAAREIKEVGEFKGEIWHKRRDGTVFPTYMNNSLLCDKSGKPIGMIGTLRDITDLKKVENDLRDSEERYRTLHNNVPVGVFQSSAEGILISVNPAMVNMLGYGSDLQLIGVPLASIYDDPKRRKRLLKMLNSDGSVTDFELSARRKDGAVIWISASIHAVFDSNGNIERLDGIAIDVTDRKKAKEDLRSAHERLNATLNALPDLLFEVDSNGYILDYRAPDPDVLYRPPEEFLGKRVDQCLPPEASEYIMKAIEEAVESGQSRGVVYSLHMDEEVRWFEISAAAKGDPKSSDGRLIMLARDITDRRRAEEAVRESEEKFRRVFEDSVLGLYRTAPDGRILMVNPTLLKMLGYKSFEELSKRSLEESGYEPGYPRSAFKDQIEKKGMVAGLESAWTKADGTVLHVRESARAIRNDDGKALYYEGTVEDITRHKYAEKALQESEERYRLLIENAGNPIILHDPEGATLMLNSTAAQLLGGNPDDFVGKRLDEIFPPDKAEFFMSLIHEVIETGAGRESEEFLEMPTGDRWFWSNLQLVKDTGGNIMGVQVILHDITERKLAERELELSNKVIEQERNMFISGPVVVFKWKNRPGWPVEYVSPNVEEVMGYTVDELISGEVSFAEIIPDEDVEAVMNEVEAYSESGPDSFSHQPYRIIRKDGEIIWIANYLTILRNITGKITHYLGYIVNITERRLAEEMLRNRTEQLDIERKALQEKNIALNEVLEHIESQRQDHRRHVYQDVEEALTPFLKRLREKAGPDLAEDYEELMDVFNAILIKDMDEFTGRYARLTSRESEVCELIKKGMSSKQISESLNLSILTILKHREQIRKKLEITNKSINLATYLRSH